MSRRALELAERAEETATLLAHHGVDLWADWVAEDAARLRRRDFAGVEHLLSAFRGMGSLNDVWICPENGHPIASAEVPAVNKRLDRLRSRLYSLASRLRPDDLAADGSERGSWRRASGIVEPVCAVSVFGRSQPHLSVSTRGGGSTA